MKRLNLTGKTDSGDPVSIDIKRPKKQKIITTSIDENGNLHTYGHVNYTERRSNFSFNKLIGSGFFKAFFVLLLFSGIYRLCCGYEAITFKSAVSTLATHTSAFQFGYLPHIPSLVDYMNLGSGWTFIIGAFIDIPNSVINVLNIIIFLFNNIISSLRFIGSIIEIFFNIPFIDPTIVG